MGRGLFGEQNRRLASFFVASRKDSETKDAADLSDNRAAGSKNIDLGFCVPCSKLLVVLIVNRVGAIHY